MENFADKLNKIVDTKEKRILDEELAKKKRELLDNERICNEILISLENIFSDFVNENVYQIIGDKKVLIGYIIAETMFKNNDDFFGTYNYYLATASKNDEDLNLDVVDRKNNGFVVNAKYKKEINIFDTSYSFNGGYYNKRRDLEGKEKSKILGPFVKINETIEKVEKKRLFGKRVEVYNKIERINDLEKLNFFIDRFEKHFKNCGRIVKIHPIERVPSYSLNEKNYYSIYEYELVF